MNSLIAVLNLSLFGLCVKMSLFLSILVEKKWVSLFNVLWSTINVLVLVFGVCTMFAAIAFCYN